MIPKNGVRLTIYFKLENNQKRQQNRILKNNSINANGMMHLTNTQFFKKKNYLERKVYNKKKVFQQNNFIFIIQYKEKIHKCFTSPQQDSYIKEFKDCLFSRNYKQKNNSYQLKYNQPSKITKPETIRVDINHDKFIVGICTLNI